ncbi:YciE/YciF ferroxidase family protein [Natronococcus wangiae]|uniref:YciE/YciF ferroxidase family protein n=1 Tax=Natronococcus wangiae TaxID=3068275 RepID=UPI00273DF959|nr:DUF892 family protein [Natronococcus sp. AD5]
MNVETLEDLFGYQLQHVYYAERTHVELLEEMAADGATDELGARFDEHREQTERHVERIEQVFEALGQRPRASRTRTVDGLADARRARRESANGGTAVPGDIEIGMLAERLEIRSYEMLLRLAGRLGFANDVVEPLEAILEEERETLQEFEDLETEQSILETLKAEEA